MLQHLVPLISISEAVPLANESVPPFNIVVPTHVSQIEQRAQVGELGVDPLPLRGDIGVAMLGARLHVDERVAEIFREHK